MKKKNNITLCDLKGTRHYLRVVRERKWWMPFIKTKTLKCWRCDLSIKQIDKIIRKAKEDAKSRAAANNSLAS